MRIKNVLSLLGLVLIASPIFAQGEAAQAQESATTVLWYWLLVGLVGAMVLSIIGKIIKVSELTFELSGKKKNINWTYINGCLFVAFLVLGMYGAFWEFKVHGSILLPESASEHGLETDHLFNVTLWITGIVFVLTHILLFGYAYKFRNREGNKALYYPHNNKLEIYWTVTPAIVLTILVVLGWRTWTDITSADRHKDENPVLVEVVAEQFRWTARYPGADNELGKSNFKLIGGINELGVDFDDTKAHDDIITREIVLPVGKPIKFAFGAKDVIHSAYMPHFRVQMNCVPGLPTYFYFTPRLTTQQMREKVGDFNFDYVLLCAKICGAAHYNMQMKVTVLEEKEYNEWLKKQQPFYTEDVKKQLEEGKKEVKEEIAAKEVAQHEI
jgi:cytochrome c oxidase subunit II